ncbi:S41 family peptidase [Flavobacterium sp.]|uniref:S41 family peptidase n=1 Tax=Flavobacterium sp. TaxID=239 RepID=UPI0040345045
MIKAIFTIILLVAGTLQQAFSQDMLSRKQMEQEIDAMVGRIVYSHVNAYHYRSKQEWDVFLKEVKSGLPDSLSRFGFWRKAEQVLVFMNDAHTRTYPSVFYKEYTDRGGLFLPFTIQKKEDVYHAAEIYGDTSNIDTFKSIISINGVPMAAIYADMKKQCGKELDLLDEKAICGSFPYYVWKVYGWEPPYSVIWSGSNAPVMVQGVTSDKLENGGPLSPKKEICSLSFLNEATALITVIDFETMPRSYYKKFYRKAFREINRRGIKNLVLDLRGNDGGDSRYCEDMARYFADKPFRISSRTLWKVTPEFKTNFTQLYIPGIMRWAKFLYGINEHTKAIWKTGDGAIAVVEHKERKPYRSALKHPKKVYLLIDNDTFSAGSMFAAMVKDYNLGILVGQPTGNLSSFYADPLMWYMLPNSRITFQVSTSLNVRPNGKLDNDSIQPDILLPESTDALEYVLELIGN